MERRHIGCHLCTSTRSRPFLERRGFTLVRCEECGLYYVTPQPTLDELKALYARYDLGSQWEQGEIAYTQAIVRLVSELHPAARVLDIGCGDGQLCGALRAAGHHSVGLELTQSKGVENAMTKHRVPVFVGSVTELAASPLAQERFHVVILSNVLEHLLDPLDTLVKIQDLLADDGALLVVVPNVFLHLVVGKVRRWLGRPNPYLLDVHPTPLVAFQPPLHLTSFSPRTLRGLLDKAGYDIACMRHAPPVFSGRKGFVAKDYLKRCIVWCSNAICRLTGNQCIPGYSILAIGQKR